MSLPAIVERLAEKSPEGAFLRILEAEFAFPPRRCYEWPRRSWWANCLARRCGLARFVWW